MDRFLYYNELKFRLIRHLVLIAVLMLFFSSLLFLGGNHHDFLDAFQTTAANSLFFLFYAYLTLFWFIPAFLLKGNVPLFLVLFILTGVLFSSGKLLVSDELFYASVSPEYFRTGNPKLAGRLLVNMKDMTFLVALFCVGKFTKDFIYTERQLEKLNAQNSEARNRLLHSQLNPHFLYNTINNLYALSLLEPGQTLKVTQKIERVLEYTVEQSRHHYVPLEEEISLVKNYLSLEQLRYDKQLKVKFAVSGRTADWQIPPMVLFFLAENVLRQESKSGTGFSWLTIAVDAQPDNLMIEVRNSKPRGLGESNEEFWNRNGLQNLKKRLDILYPERRYELSLEENKDFFSIKLRLSKLVNGLGRTTYR